MKETHGKNERLPFRHGHSLEIVLGHRLKSKIRTLKQVHKKKYVDDEDVSEFEDGPAMESARDWGGCE